MNKEQHTAKRVLVACEESQEVCKAFRALGHEAYSCDLLPCSGGHPEWHIQGNALHVMSSGRYHWDLVISFPPCTHLAVSGARWFKDKKQEQADAIEFFHKVARWSNCIENPIGIMSTHYRKPEQIIQPWQFGHGETKATCLWLNGLPNLKPTNVVPGREQRIWKLPPTADRAKLRSKTFPGIAKAMAEQWGGLSPYGTENHRELIEANL